MDEISYARAGDTHVAYWTFGAEGAVDVVVVTGALFPVEMLLEDRIATRFLHGLGSLGRVVVFDRRGVGLSDPLTDWSRSTRDQWAEDLFAVIDAAGLDRPVVVSWEPYGTARRAASLRPDRIGGLVLVNPVATTELWRQRMIRTGGSTLPSRTVEELAFPSRRDDPAFVAWLTRAGRSGASPTAAERVWELMLGHEGSLTPENLSVPSLVLHNRDCLVTYEEVQSVADAIPGAKLVEVAGPDIYPVAGDVDALVVETVSFVTGTAPDLARERSIAVVLFTDLVDSTQRASREGDRRWRDLLDVHDRVVEHHVSRHGGRVVKYTGDGVLALLPSATIALDTARAIIDELGSAGLELRAGAHVGDVDIRGDDVSGIVVNVAARIMAQAGAGEVLVSESLRLATLGSGFRFSDTRVAELKGVPGEWVLHRWEP